MKSTRLQLTSQSQSQSRSQSLQQLPREAVEDVEQQLPREAVEDVEVDVEGAALQAVLGAEAELELASAPGVKVMAEACHHADDASLQLRNYQKFLTLTVRGNVPRVTFSTNKEGNDASFVSGPRSATTVKPAQSTTTRRWKSTQRSQSQSQSQTQSRSQSQQQLPREAVEGVEVDVEGAALQAVHGGRRCSQARPGEEDGKSLPPRRRHQLVIEELPGALSEGERECPRPTCRFINKTGGGVCEMCECPPVSYSDASDSGAPLLLPGYGCNRSELVALARLARPEQGGVGLVAKSQVYAQNTGFADTVQRAWSMQGEAVSDRVAYDRRYAPNHTAASREAVRQELEQLLLPGAPGTPDPFLALRACWRAGGACSLSPAPAELYAGAASALEAALQARLATLRTTVERFQLRFRDFAPSALALEQQARGLYEQALVVKGIGAVYSAMVLNGVGSYFSGFDLLAGSAPWLEGQRPSLELESVWLQPAEFSTWLRASTVPFGSVYPPAVLDGWLRPPLAELSAGLGDARDALRAAWPRLEPSGALLRDATAAWLSDSRLALTALDPWGAGLRSGPTNPASLNATPLRTVPAGGVTGVGSWQAAPPQAQGVDLSLVQALAGGPRAQWRARPWLVALETCLAAGPLAWTRRALNSPSIRSAFVGFLFLALVAGAWFTFYLPLYVSYVVWCLPSRGGGGGGSSLWGGTLLGNFTYFLA
eukprot:g62456.t1